MDLSDLKNYGSIIQRIINKGNLSLQETYEMFKETLLNRQPDLQQGAFLAALVSKGETVEELAGAWQAIDEFDTLHLEDIASEGLFENSGTGMDELKTFNVSSASAIVASACGVKMARHGARAITSKHGTVDILESMGIDVECDINTVGRSIKTAGIGLFNGMSPKVHPGALGRILSQIRFGTTLNIAASLANPCRPSMGLRGVYAEGLLNKVAETMKIIGYKRAMVVHGRDKATNKGMDEISLCGNTKVVEFNNNHIEQYQISPSDFALKDYSYHDIAALDNCQEESRRFITVIAGKGFQPCIDFTALNAGAILYISGAKRSIREGIDDALEAIHKGKALSKLCEWVTQQNTSQSAGLELLNKRAKEAGIRL